MVCTHGEAGMGAVYLVRTEGGRQIALKTFSPQIMSRVGAESTARFIAEPRAAAKLDHPCGGLTSTCDRLT